MFYVSGKISIIDVLHSLRLQNMLGACFAVLLASGSAHYLSILAIIVVSFDESCVASFVASLIVCTVCLTDS
jgi:hypothetical protein